MESTAVFSYAWFLPHLLTVHVTGRPGILWFHCVFKAMHGDKGASSLHVSPWPYLIQSSGK